MPQTHRTVGVDSFYTGAETGPNWRMPLSICKTVRLEANEVITISFAASQQPRLIEGLRPDLLYQNIQMVDETRGLLSWFSCTKLC